MTLLLTAVTKQHVIHASDRLVSLAPRRKEQTPQPWDSAANKTAVVVASDGWLVISYTGLAYLRGRPTDQWIAETVSEIDLSSGGFIGWPRPEVFHVQHIAEAIRDGANDVFNNAPPNLRRQPLEIHIAGVQNASPRIAHLQWTVHNKMGPFVLHKADLSQFRWDSGYSLMIGGSHQVAAVERMRQRLRDEGEESPEHFRDIMVECIRGTSAVTPGIVGQDAMTVIFKPGTNRMETLYVPAGGPFTEVEPAYAPWALLPGIVMAPALVSGHQEWGLNGGGPTYVVSGPELTAGTMTYGTYKRRADPAGSAVLRPTAHLWEEALRPIVTLAGERHAASTAELTRATVD